MTNTNIEWTQVKNSNINEQTAVINGATALVWQHSENEFGARVTYSDGFVDQNVVWNRTIGAAQAWCVCKAYQG
jgi:hypothetical protein